MAQSYCVPVTTTYCCNYGITSVSLPNLTHASANASEGYRDFSGFTAQATEGEPLNVALETDGTEPHDVRIWLDADNDGTFGSTELVFEALGTTDPSGVMALPAGTPTGTPLRLRIMADFMGSDPQPCQNPTRGQAEDYTFVLTASGTAPVADFTAQATYTCNGVVNFTQQSTGSPTQYLWDFGDGQTSTLADPPHTYQNNGTYTVSLTVGNSQGSHTQTKTDYVQVAITETCDTFAVPAQGTASILYTYRFVVMDNGRTGNYGNETRGMLSLSPVGAQKVCLHFTEFNFEKGFDYLELYDGPTDASPLIGRYDGTELPPPVCSSGPALCLKQYSDDVVTYPGFVAQATTQMGLTETTLPGLAVYPNPFTEYIQLTLPPDLNGQAFTLHLTNTAGQTLWRQRYAHDAHASLTINTSDIPAGLYLVYLQSPTGVWQQKLLKIK